MTIEGGHPGMARDRRGEVLGVIEIVRDLGIAETTIIIGRGIVVMTIGEVQIVIRGGETTVDREGISVDLNTLYYQLHDKFVVSSDDVFSFF